MKIIRNTVLLIILMITLAFADYPYQLLFSNYFRTSVTTDRYYDGIYLKNYDFMLAIDILNNDLIVAAEAEYGISVFKRISNANYTQNSHTIVTRKNLWTIIQDIAISPDSIIFAVGKEGVFAYKFTGDSLLFLDQAENGNYCYGVTYIDNNIVYVGAKKLKKYSFQNGRFEFIAESNLNLYAKSITIYKNYIYAACHSFGFWILKDNETELEVITGLYDQDSYTEVNDVEVDDKGRIFLANYRYLKVYSFNGSEAEEICTMGGSNTDFRNISINANGTIFASCLNTGLYAFRLEEDTLTIMARYSNRLEGVDVVALDIGFVYVNESEGLNFLKYTGAAFDYFEGNFELTANYPNPFNSTTNIKYTIKNNCDVAFTLYDLKGTKIKKWDRFDQTQGIYEFPLNFKDSQSGSLHSGMYILTMTDGVTSQSKKILYIK